MSTTAFGRAMAGAALILLAGCELAETTIPPGDDVLVVEAVLDAGMPVQHVLLHRSLNGRVVAGEESAIVRVRRDDGDWVGFPLDPTRGCLVVDTAYAAGKDQIDVQASCYTSPAAAGAWVLPGRSYELSVETADGRKLRGRTVVPGDFAFVGLSPEAAPPEGGVGQCTLAAESALALAWTQAAGTMAYATHVRITGARNALAGRGLGAVPDTLDLVGASITQNDTTIVLPRDAVGFEPDKYPREIMKAIEPGLPDGVRVRVTVGAMEKNFVDAVRGGRFHPSGRLRVSSVVGDGVGLFGAVLPRVLELEVRQGEAEDCVMP